MLYKHRNFANHPGLSTKWIVYLENFYNHFTMLRWHSILRYLVQHRHYVCVSENLIITFVSIKCNFIDPKMTFDLKSTGILQDLHS